MIYNTTCRNLRELNARLKREADNAEATAGDYTEICFNSTYGDG